MLRGWYERLGFVAVKSEIQDSYVDKYTGIGGKLKQPALATFLEKELQLISDTNKSKLYILDFISWILSWSRFKLTTSSNSKHIKANTTLFFKTCHNRLLCDVQEVRRNAFLAPGICREHNVSHCLRSIRVQKANSYYRRSVLLPCSHHTERYRLQNLECRKTNSFIGNLESFRAQNKFQTFCNCSLLFFGKRVG